MKRYYNYVQVDNKAKRNIKMAKKKKLCFDFDENLYSKLDDVVENESVGLIFKTAATGSNCYFYAFLLANALPQSELVHGALHNRDFVDAKEDFYVNVFNHAWVERGNFVFDTTEKCVFNKKTYYEIFDVEKKKSFSQEDLLKKENFIKIGIYSIKDRPLLIDRLFKMKRFKNVSVEEIEKFSSGLQKDLVLKLKTKFESKERCK